MKQRTDLRKHMQSLLRRNGLHYKAETGNKAHWTKLHYCWLDRTIDDLSGSVKVNLELQLCQLKGMNGILTVYPTDRGAGQNAPLRETGSSPDLLQRDQATLCPNHDHRNR